MNACKCERVSDHRGGHKWTNTVVNGYYGIVRDNSKAIPDRLKTRLATFRYRQRMMKFVGERQFFPNGYFGFRQDKDDLDTGRISHECVYRVKQYRLAVQP